MSAGGGIRGGGGGHNYDGGGEDTLFVQFLVQPFGYQLGLYACTSAI